ncbi:hypothetical protein IE4803_PB00413 (plasmid) [Rhizobium etli bv. phaseoli str. IE4803]|nr:hypothetical protein IE4803_PB00413 [Rhizobium etli bv. phaseoli str. IE4803]ARQ60851.1 hypothetical protein Kim5_PA00386 [Rhizobium sp. Kim5]
MACVGLDRVTVQLSPLAKKSAVNIVKGLAQHGFTGSVARANLKQRHLRSKPTRRPDSSA